MMEILITKDMKIIEIKTLRKNCLYSELFWSVFSRIRS